MKKELNDMKSYIMNSFHYIKKVYNGGIESFSQFNTFSELCQNHVNNCNILCKSIKPTVMYIQFNKTNRYKELRELCAYTVDEIKDMILEWQESYQKHLKELEVINQIETRARIEHKIAIELKESELERFKNERNPIGFNKINKTEYE